MRCCGECFGDRGLTDSVIPSLSDERGACSFCLTENAILVTPGKLAAHFGLLVNTYERDENGRLLVEWMKDDWDMFYHPRMDTPRAKELLAEILDNGEVVRQRFSPSARYQSDRLNRWEELRSELMSKNRYFPSTHLDGDRLGQLLAHLPARELPTKWFRARIQASDSPFTIEQMGAPPHRLASLGRANPPGIPYLYLASSPETAVSEIRPHTGEVACVADFVVGDQIKVVDLRKPRRLVSPFLLAAEEEIGLLRSDISFLERLGDELTRPVLPQGASIDYVPSQYLCEFIKKCGYDGVLYRSSVATGINLALFSPSQATPGAVRQYKAALVSVQVAPL